MLTLGLSGACFAQADKDKTSVTFDELYDEPYSINKLFIGFQPIYGDVFATNVNAGFGAEASYYYRRNLISRRTSGKPTAAHFLT